ncbi:MAG: hypothetical protein EOL95_01480 [Bacteroidia bacterium]|nr:hypothetical protein [Bacteroidia bacterium]
MKKLDNFYLGLVSCLLLPFLFFVVTWNIISGSPLSEVSIWLRQPVFLQYLIFCSLPDLLILFWGYHTDRWNICRGGILGLTPYLMMLFYLFF